MNNLFLAASGNNSSNIWMIIGIVLLFALMYFSMMRPQKKQQQKRMEMMNQLKKGDTVVLIDGMYGKIDSVNTKEKTIVVDADGIYLTFNRMAVQKIISAPTEEKPAPTAAEENAKQDAKAAAVKKDEAPEAKQAEPEHEKEETSSKD